MTIEQHVALINRLSKNKKYKLALLGGPEDTERNEKIKELCGDKVITTATTEGLRKGLCYIDACDLIITGDSLGMHASIGLKKYVLVWFGVSCWSEVDLYDFGKKFVPKDLFCSPCWKKVCPYNLECIQMIDLDGIVSEIDNFYKNFF
jgi:heptosyltransferase-2